ncbi:MAG: ABC transporter permease [Actinomycetota bacterium]|nr:ABC transporter permease [Acidimicrobiia bacterium]MDQ3292945.1 ABC transporter permease [Actinomycetota bacterium]
MTEGSTANPGLLVLEPRPASRRVWAADVWAHREVFAMLAQKDFQTRYKRASLGVLWAVAVPVLQGVVLAVVFSKIVRFGGAEGFGAYVFGGVLAFSYFSGTMAAGVTSIVDGAGLTDKVWFPRVLLVLVPGVANLVGLCVSMVVLIVALPFLGVTIGPRIMLLVPATALLVGFTIALSMVVSALHVYFRDVKFLVQAALLMWLYVTPILYPKELLGGLAPWIDLNPLTGIVTLIHMATLGGDEAWVRPVVVSIVATVALALAGVEGQRRHDRLFVDYL